MMLLTLKRNFFGCQCTISLDATYEELMTKPSIDRQLNGFICSIRKS